MMRQGEVFDVFEEGRDMCPIIVFVRQERPTRYIFKSMSLI